MSRTELDRLLMQRFGILDGLAGARIVVGWDRLVLCELVED